MKKKKTKKKTLIKILYLSAIALEIYILILGIDMHYTGFHNTDICHNEIIINAENNLKYIEMRLDGKTWSLENCYLDGLKKIRNSQPIITLSSFILGILTFPIIKKWIQ